jgi:predicted Zn finger-like uncharacterized protein
MYTQCPDCDTAFRVTAPDLQRAAGRVVCVGCTREFNALERLTEDAPAAPDRADDERAIFETLDELTGPDEIRIEDTGVEWRVIVEDDSADEGLLQADDSEAEPDWRSSGRWYIADITGEPDGETEVALDDGADTGRPDSDRELPPHSRVSDESPEPLLEDAGTSSLQESLQLPPAVRGGDVQRYDDNTPLSDDFIDEREPGVPQRRAEDRIEPRSPEADEAQVDLALGEPDDWMELLDEVGPPSGANSIESPGLESTGEALAAGGALADTDVRPMTEEEEFAVDDGFPSDIDTQFDLQAIELGIDLTGRRLSLQDGTEDPDEYLRQEDGPAEEHLDDELTDSPDGQAQAEHFVPPATEEEMTINMLIDQDLIRLAEQQNVFASAKEHQRPDSAPYVETIILEGESVRSALEEELLAEKLQESGASHVASDRVSGKESATGAAGGKGAAAEDDGIPLDSYMNSKDRGGRGRRDSPGYGVIAGTAALSLVLAAQVVHAYRDTLATSAMFEKTVGSVYRLLGEPLIPGWNVREWNFEGTSGSTDDMDEVLTISSRIANSSAKPLPYPLLHVSLTDRWEEIIGSKVLEPAEYLAGSADPADRVNPGESFTAVVRVEAPAPEATGFKLNVCYPETGDRVRCATEDFKD